MSAVFSWKIFQDSLMGAVTSIVDNRNLIKESKFPQYIIPVSVVLSNFINNLPPIMLLFVFSQAILRKIPVFAFMLPLVIVNQVIFTASLAVIFSLLYVKYRDIKYIVELLLMLFFYLTPVFYSLSLVEGILNSNLYLAYICNPLVGILSQYRSVFINGYLEFILLHAGFLSLIIIPVASTVVCLLVCICLFRKVKDEINDYLSY
jgi:ABC-2 type transport system permease protein